MLLRTFIAVEAPGEIIAQASKLVGRLQTAGAEVKWVEPEHMHFTLKFLGGVRDRDLGELCLALARATRDLRPFEIDVRGAGAFPDAARPRTLWLGVGDGSAEFAALFESLEDRLADLGFRQEGRRFQPHLTLGRVRNSSPGGRELASVLREQAEFEAGPMYVDEVVLFSSELGRDGPRYEVLSRGELLAR
jgi:2'-5' RNA ligase